jgi:hypothetical protein
MATYEALFGVTPGSGKTTSSILSKAMKKLRKYIGTEEQFKQIWKIARNGLDTMAGIAGIPLGELRRELNNRGIDVDPYDEEITKALLDLSSTDGSLNASPDQLNDIFKVAENNNKDPQAMNPMWQMAIFGGLAFLLLGGRGMGGGRRRGRGRRRRRY